MRQQQTLLVRAVAAGAAFVMASPLAAAAAKEPSAVRVAYNPAALEATVSWNDDVPDVFSHVVERRPVGQPAWTRVAQVTGGQRSVTDKSIQPLTRYEYRVLAFHPGRQRDGYVSTNTALTPLDFPYKRPYAHGIRPSNHSQAQMDADVRDMYALWRATYVTTAGSGEGGARVYKPAEGGETVSEGQGYGMLISVYMADAGNAGKSDFDKMLTYYKAKLKKNADGSSRSLMNWKIRADGSVADPWVAPDGDLDVAFALLVADRKWGSGNGNPDYLGEARAILDALQKYAVFNRSVAASKLVANGDKDPGWQEGAGSFTMSSYQMVGYMQQFAAVSDSLRAAQWRDTLKAGYQAFSYFYKTYPGTALTPFTFLTQPGPKQYGKGSRGHTFGPDSSRVPWRVAMDYVWHGGANSAWVNSQDPSVPPGLAKDMPNVNVKWFMATTKGNPSDMWYSYNLDGSKASTFRWGQRHTAGSMAAGAMTDASNQEHLNRLYDWMRQQIPGQDHTAGGFRVPHEYFGDTVLMMNMLMVTGNMPNLPGVALPAR